MEQPTRELTRAIASGDTEAFARFYEQWFDVMYAEARRATAGGCDESFCLDVVQDAMMKVIRSMPVLDTDSALRLWLRRVVVRCAYDRLRAEARRRRREIDRGAPHEAAGGEVEERIRWLRGEMDRLDDESRDLLSMRFRFGWTLARIGAAVGLKPGAVDSRISRILTRLRRRAQEESDE